MPRYTVSGMTCSGCVARVQTALRTIDPQAQVQLQPPEASLNSADVDAVNALLSTVGSYRLSPIASQASAVTAGRSSAWSTYKPLALIIFFIALVVTLEWLRSPAGVSAHSWMSDFMAGFFLVFGFFKLLNLRAFAQTFKGYDLAARHIPGYALAYPFIEIGLGVAYLMRWNPTWVNWITVGVMLVGSIGVIQALRSGKVIDCACLGTVFKLPMSRVTLLEDLLMLGMAVWMLAQRHMAVAAAVLIGLVGSQNIAQAQEIPKASKLRKAPDPLPRPERPEPAASITDQEKNKSSRAAFEITKALGRGINLGNFFDAPSEGAWGMRYEEALLDRVKEAGFNTLRLPVRWSQYAGRTAPYRIDAKFMERIASVVKAAQARGLYVVMDMHHYRQLNDEALDPGEEKVAASVVEERFIAMWAQIAEYFKDYPETLLFEPFNEPHKRLEGEAWNLLFERARAVIRKTNPNRFIVVGPTRWNNASALPGLKLNPTDRRLIVTIHHYEPFEFTHQGAEWTTIDSKGWLGTTCCNAEQKVKIEKPLRLAQQWSQFNDRPIWVGEWGSYSKAALDSRLNYTRTMVRALQKFKFSWAYWELASGFGIYDPQTKQWRADLKEALMGNQR